MAKVVLDKVNTDIIPVVDFGMQYGALSWVSEDVLDVYYIDIDDYTPEELGESEYAELVQLVNEGYDGMPDFIAAVARLAPYYIQQALDDYDIPARVIPDSCEFDGHANMYRDTRVEFDMMIDVGWVESKFFEFSEDPEFISFIKQKYSSRSGFISSMPNTIEGLTELLDPHDYHYWKLVAEIIQFIVAGDEYPGHSATEDLIEDLRCNGYYTSRSDVGIDR